MNVKPMNVCISVDSEWIDELNNEAAQEFPYETEETCPNALDRMLKNQCIDCIRTGYVRGYIQGTNDSLPFA